MDQVYALMTAAEADALTQLDNMITRLKAVESAAQLATEEAHRARRALVDGVYARQPKG